jgi:hypothetical protein
MQLPIGGSRFLVAPTVPYHDCLQLPLVSAPLYSPVLGSLFGAGRETPRPLSQVRQHCDYQSAG